MSKQPKWPGELTSTLGLCSALIKCPPPSLRTGLFYSKGEKKPSCCHEIQGWQWLWGRGPGECLWRELCEWGAVDVQTVGSLLACRSDHMEKHWHDRDHHTTEENQWAVKHKSTSRHAHDTGTWTRAFQEMVKTVVWSLKSQLVFFDKLGQLKSTQLRPCSFTLIGPLFHWNHYIFSWSCHDLCFSSSSVASIHC